MIVQITDTSMFFLFDHKNLFKVTVNIAKSPHFLGTLATMQSHITMLWPVRYKQKCCKGHVGGLLKGTHLTGRIALLSSFTSSCCDLGMSKWWLKQQQPYWTMKWPCHWKLRCKRKIELGFSDSTMKPRSNNTHTPTPNLFSRMGNKTLSWLNWYYLDSFYYS